MQGIHAPRVLIIFDEAGGIPAQLWIAAEAIATNDDCRILAIGNPDFPQGPFRDAWDSEQWNSIRISALENPNFTNEECPVSVKSQLASVEWVNDCRAKWGETSPIYQSKVLGVFPSSAEDSVIDYAKLIACQNVELENDDNDAVVLGIDVAGGGSDLTVVRERRGNRAMRQWTISTPDSGRLVEWLVGIIAEAEAKAVRIDSTGIGWGLIGALREKCPDVMIAGVNSSSTPAQPGRFLNARAEMWWNGRMLVENGKLDLTQAMDTHSLIAEMTAPKWSLNSRGKIQIESKDDIRTRMGRSPDHADALLLAFYDRMGLVTNEEEISRPARMKLGEALQKQALGQIGTPGGLGLSRQRIGVGRWV